MLYAQNLVAFKAFGDEETTEPETQTVDVTATPEFQSALEAKIAEAVEAATTGLKSKNSEILGEKKKVQDQLNKILAQAEDEKDQEDLKAGKLDVQSLIDKRVNAASQTWQEKLAAEQNEKEQLKKLVEEKETQFKQYQIKQQIGSEALKNEFFHPAALDDLLSLAGGAWELSETGDLVTRDKFGNVAVGKSGKPLSPSEWVESLTQSKPHYFKQVPGSGGKQGSGGSAKTMSRAEWQAKIVSATEKEQAELFAKRASGEIVIQ